MTVNGIGGVSVPQQAMGTSPAADQYSRSLQRQIAEEQKNLQELSSSQELSPEEKMKKRQEISQKIAELNQELRQHQTEVRRQAAQQKENSREEKQGENSRMQKKNDIRETGMSGESMQALLSSDSSLKQAEVQGSVKLRLEGRAGVLKAEIKQDGNLGTNTAIKEKELAEAENRAADIEKAQGNTLAEAGKKLQGRGVEEGSGPRAEEESRKEAGKEDEKEKVEKENAEKEKAENEKGEKAKQELPQGYVPVDIKL